MSQVATMNVRIGADIAPLQRGLKDAQASVDQSAKLMGTSLSSAATSTDGTRVASQFVRGLQSEFSAKSTQLKAALFQGSLTPEQFKREGVIAAQQFNSGITSGLDQFGAQGLLTPETESKMVAKYKRAGLSAGESLNNGLSPALERGGEKFELMGHKGEHALLKITGGMMGLAAATDNTEAPLMRVSKGIEGIALMMGPEGFFVAAILQAGEVLWHFFTKAQDEADATRKKFADMMTGLANAGDIAGLNKAFKDLKYGQLTSVDANGNAVVNARSPYAANAAVGSMSDLQARRSLLLKQAGHASADQIGVIDRQVAQLDTLLAPMIVSMNGLLRAGAAVALTPSDTLIGNALSAGSKGADGSGKGRGASSVGSDSAGRIFLPEIADFWQQMKAGGDLVGRKLNLTIEDATANAKLLTTAFGASNDKAALLPVVFSEAEKLQAAALRTLQQWPDPLADANIKARQLMTTLQPLIEAGALQLAFATHGITNDDPQSVIARNGGFGETGTGKNGFADANVGMIPPKLDTLHTAVTAGLDTLNTTMQQVGVGMAQTLGAKLGGGGVASGIGGLMGSAIGDGVAKSFLKGAAGKAIGSMLGGTVGSVIPVVGTVLGAVAGSVLGGAVGKIGGFIGGLFGGHKKAVDNSASALNSLAATAQKVSESLSNVPTGFKIALARYDATDAGYGSPALPPTSGAGGGGVHIYGPITFTGVQNPGEFYREMGNFGLQQDARGGTTAMSLAY